MQLFLDLFGNVLNFTWQQVVMILVGALLVYLAVKREMEPSLLLPMGFGAILVNLPFVHTEAIETLFNAGIASELFPLLLFIGIGARIDFGPLLSCPKMFLFGAAAQFGIFFTLVVAVIAGFDLKDAASTAIIAAKPPSAAALMPLMESSTTMHSFGESESFSAALQKINGSGLLLPPVSSPKTIASKSFSTS